MVQESLIGGVDDNKVFLLERRAVLPIAGDFLVLLPPDEVRLVAVVEARTEVE